MSKVLFTVFLLSFFLLLSGTTRADSLSAMILSDSSYVLTKGLSALTQENLPEVYDALIERASDKRTNIDIRLKIIDKLSTFSGQEPLTALISITDNTREESSFTQKTVPPEILNAGSLKELLNNVENYSKGHFPHYPIMLLSGASELNLADVLKESLSVDAPPTIQLSALARIQYNQIAHTAIADKLIDLTQSPLPPVRALAYRAISLKFPKAEVADFVKGGLSDDSVLVRSCVLSSVETTLPPGLEPHLATASRNESDPETYKQISRVVEAYESTYLISALTDFCSVVLVIILIGLIASIPLFIKWQKQMKFRNGLREIRRSNFEKAKTIFKDVISSHPELKERASLHLARVHLRENDVKRAMDIVRELDLPSFEPEDLYELACDLDGKSLKAGAARTYLNILVKDADYKDVQDRFDDIDVKFGGGRDESKESTSGTTSMKDLAKKLLSKEYSGISMIGKGGMGAVFKAKNKQTGEVSAIKILTPTLADDESLKTRFYRESVAIANLSHRNICKVRDIRKAELPFIVMEYIEGADLKNILKERKEPYSLKEFYDIALQVVDALVLAHSKHIVHRDIKPENLLITKEGVPKLIDFGLVKFKESASDITATGAMMGTPKYMSPEQIKGEADIGVTTDIFSIGMVFYEMLTLKYPFPKDAVFQRVFMEAMPLRPHNENVSAQLESIILKCLQRHPVERFDSAQELKSMLEISRDF